MRLDDARSMSLPLLLACLLAALAALDPGGLIGRLREAAFDRLMVQFPRDSSDDGVVIVDIDGASLASLGAWPWPRELQAKLVERIVAAQPAALAVDIAYLEPDRSSPAALARRLARETGRSDFDELARGMTDGDLLLADAIGNGTVSLGLLLQPKATGTEPPPLSIAIEGGTPALSPWQMDGMIGPADPLFSAATGFGVLSLPVEPNGLVRFVPLITATPGNVFAGLAVEALRLAEGVSVPVLESQTSTLSVGRYAIPLGEKAEARLYPAPLRHWQGKRFSAADLLTDGALPVEQLKGRIVLLGGSSPELGVLRATATDPATPSVLIHANMAEQIRAGVFPLRPHWMLAAEIVFALALSVAAVVMTARFGPLGGLLLVLAGIGAWLALSVLAFLRLLWLADPVLPTAIPGFAYLSAAIGGFVASRARESRLRQRFAQRLDPAVVERIVADPSALKLDGTHRDITVLFTDIEGFTALTERSDPRALIAALDRYIERIGGLVVAHGGMVDKIVGDSVHAIFNAPLDLADHPRRAVECALAIARAAESLAREPAMAAIGLGRTRIGIETGRAVVGDVGGKDRLDYTAHGDVINMAARLEALNKDFGSTILVGPAARAAVADLPMTSRGEIELRGLSRRIEVFEPLIQA